MTPGDDGPLGQEHLPGEPSAPAGGATRREGRSPGKRTLVEAVYGSRPSSATPMGWGGGVDQNEPIQAEEAAPEPALPSPAAQPSAEQTASVQALADVAPAAPALDAHDHEDDAEGEREPQGAPIQRKEAPGGAAAGAAISPEKLTRLLEKRLKRLVKKVRGGKMVPAEAMVDFFAYDKQLGDGKASLEMIPISVRLLAETTIAFVEHLKEKEEEARQRAAAEEANAAAGASAKSPTFKKSFKDADIDGFKKRVYARETALYIAAGKKYFPGLKAEEMSEVESGKLMRKDAAESCKALLAAARSTLSTQQASQDELALATTAIGCASGYRSPSADLDAWENTFAKHYHKDKVVEALEGMEGGKHGDKAVDWFAHYLRSKKATAGFSNHTSGIAMDFSTRAEIDGNAKSLGPNTDQRALWRKTWLWKWLVANAGSYGFKPLSTEEWHWDYKP